MTNKDCAALGMNPTAQDLYRRLLEILRDFGPLQEEIKKTSVHLVRKSAFVGVRFRRDHVNVTIKSEKPLRSARCVESESVSKNRWHNEVKLYTEKDFDPELSGWLTERWNVLGDEHDFRSGRNRSIRLLDVEWDWRTCFIYDIREALR